MSLPASGQPSDDLSDALQERIAAACDAGMPLAIRGGGTKSFLGTPVDGAFLNVDDHRGIVAYQPSELVLTARAGTRLTEIEATLAESGQMLPFEPPHFGPDATLGGAVAAGLSGPRRPYAGAVRDLVLGVRMLNGRGESLRFGGEVMKNVAGYDVSRLMAGSLGTLGVLLEISLKVLPRPAQETTIVREATAEEAIRLCNELAKRPLPITGAYWESGRLQLRLSGAADAVASASQSIGGEVLDDPDFWHRAREQQTPLFTGAQRLWRLSVPPTTPPMDLPGERAIDWGGAQRWLASDADAETIRATAAEAGGHATLFRGDDAPRFHPLSESLLAVHERVKLTLDPQGILNPGRLYPELDQRNAQA